MNAVTRHGYTWQDSLGAMGLNDMHGRIQDAVSGRFLSPDPLVSDSSDTQDFNRYSYVHNNPLSATDPSGYKIMNWFGNEPDQQWAKYRDAGIGGFGFWQSANSANDEGGEEVDFAFGGGGGGGGGSSSNVAAYADAVGLYLAGVFADPKNYNISLSGNAQTGF
jgi:RHS repeat-associated protein